MDWAKHKELYATPNMSKILYLALEKWKDYKHATKKTKTHTQTKLKLIDCDDV